MLREGRRASFDFPIARRCTARRTEAYFSRRGGAAPALINVLDQAQTIIHAAMYGLTNAAIVDALVAAKNRGVDVALKLDKLESAGKTQAVMITKLQAAGVPVEVSEQSRLLHHTGLTRRLWPFSLSASRKFNSSSSALTFGS
jgi:phosphatidylserine/phosphatidylglycerophosphate/cardiolipin synthase-like enzyme